MSDKWAREFLEDVATARTALERAETLKCWRQYAPIVAQDEPEDDVPDLVGEHEPKKGYEWAQNILSAFDEISRVQRQILRGELLEGLDIAEAKYRLGRKNRAITCQFAIGNDTLYRRIAALIDYLDEIGIDRAFDAPWEQDDGPDVSNESEPKTTAEMFEEMGLMPSLDDILGINN